MCWQKLLSSGSPNPGYILKFYGAKAKYTILLLFSGQSQPIIFQKLQFFDKNKSITWCQLNDILEINLGYIFDVS